jgi:RNA polymerase sigma factor (TIGR02999 family)
MTESASQITRLLHAWRSGDSNAMDQLMPLVYHQLRALASRYMRQERMGHTLGPTALVHEAYLKLLSSETPWDDRVHFMAIAAITMRRILVDHARASRRAKRGSGADHVELDDVVLLQPPMSLDILALDDAMNRLALQDARKAKLIELSYFGGMNCEEAAAHLEVSTATVNRDLKLAKAWLRQELSGASHQDSETHW